MKTAALLLFSTTLALAGCKPSERTPAAGSAAVPATATAAAAADRIEVFARHLPIAGPEDLASDPVIVRFDRFAVTKSHFDPKHLEGGTATIELDPTSIETGSEERDRDLESPDFFNVAQFAVITVDVANVKQQAGTRYTADATVACHGVTRTYPVTFEVLSTTGTAVRIKGEHAFSRLDFAIGVDPALDPTERVSPDVTIQWELTFRTS